MDRRDRTQVFNVFRDFFAGFNEDFGRLLGKKNCEHYKFGLVDIKYPDMQIQQQNNDIFAPEILRVFHQSILYLVMRSLDSYKNLNNFVFSIFEYKSSNKEGIKKMF